MLGAFPWVILHYTVDFIILIFKDEDINPGRIVTEIDVLVSPCILIHLSIPVGPECYKQQNLLGSSVS